MTTEDIYSLDIFKYIYRELIISSSEFSSNNLREIWL